jgi:CheY-like chemotaxis protein
MAATGTIRIVMAEDSATDAELAGYALRRAGIDAQLVLTATEAELRAALRTSPDIIISDNSMPGFSGRQALAIARELAPRTPFIVLSGSVSIRSGQPQGDLPGVAAWLDKNDLQRLGEVVRDVLEPRAP